MLQSLKKWRWHLCLVSLSGAIVIFFSGPRARYEAITTRPATLTLDIGDVDTYLRDKESAIAGLKPDNEARVIWHTRDQPTPYSVVFLHGFSGSHAEALPVHRDFSRRYGCNLYLHRLPQHGVDDADAFLTLSPKALVESAKEAIAIGQVIGRQVIVMSASTGSTLAIYVTRGNPAVRGMIMYSPNIALRNKAARILTWPWGLQIGRLVYGGNHREFIASAEARRYWTTRYRLEGLITLQSLLRETMTDDVLAAVDVPFFIGYYYRDEAASDDVVSIEAMRHFHDIAATPVAAKRFIAFPSAGTHILSSAIWSRDVDAVSRETFRFAEEVLGLGPVP